MLERFALTVDEEGMGLESRDWNREQGSPRSWVVALLPGANPDRLEDATVWVMSFGDHPLTEP